MLSRTSRAVGLVLLLLPLDFCPADAQNPRGMEPFTVVKEEQKIETTPEQSSRLKRILDLPTTKAVHILRINRDAQIGDEVKISIPDDKNFVFSKTGGETVDSRNFTWFGVVKGQGGGSATLIARNGEISGSINTPGGIYRISSLGDGLYAMAKMDTKKLPAEEPPKTDKNP
jgi:hypothetical protein